MQRLAARVGTSGPWLASQLPAFRPYVVERLIEEAARRNARLALMIFVPGADMPVLTAMQMRLVLRIAACYGEKISPERAVELLAVLGAGFGFRAIAREMLDFVPVAGWAVKSGDRVLGDEGAGQGGRRVLRARRGATRHGCGRGRGAAVRGRGAAEAALAAVEIPRRRMKQRIATRNTGPTRDPTEPSHCDAWS